MDREQVIAALRGHEMELRAAGVVRLSLFGSTARGDQRPDSDIDLLAVFDDPIQRFEDILENIHLVEEFYAGG